MPTQPPITLFTFWRELLLLAAAYGVIIGAVAVAVFDSQFMRAFDRCKDRITNRISDWYGPRMAKVDAAVILVDAHDDRLEAFEQSLLAQGKALSDKVGEHFSHSATALEAVTRVLEEMQKEMATTSKEVAEIRGYMAASEQWTGGERRKRVRRKPPQGGST